MKQSQIAQSWLRYSTHITGILPKRPLDKRPSHFAHGNKTSDNTKAIDLSTQ